MFKRRMIGMVLAEFLGVAVLTSVLLAVGKSGVGYSYFLSSGVALAFLGAALMIGRTSGSNFNPAVTLGLWSSRRIPTTKAVAYIVAQFAGGAAAWWLYTYLTNQALPTSPQAFAWRVLVAEMVAGFVIAAGVAAAVYHELDGLQFAATVSGAIFVGMLIASLGSNGIGNPAIALGVRNWSWAYVAGPLIGGIVGTNFYLYVLAPRPELAKAVAIAAPVRKRNSVKTVKKSK